MLRAIINAIVKVCLNQLAVSSGAPSRRRSPRSGQWSEVMPPCRRPSNSRRRLKRRRMITPEIYKQIADAIMRWACVSVIDDRPAPLPPGLPLAIRKWLPGLSREECEAIVESEQNDILAHFKGIYSIAGVRSVRSLTGVSEWPSRDRESAPQEEVGSPSLQRSRIVRRAIAWRASV